MAILFIESYYFDPCLSKSSKFQSLMEKIYLLWDTLFQKINKSTHKGFKDFHNFLVLSYLIIEGQLLKLESINPKCSNAILK